MKRRLFLVWMSIFLISASATLAATVQKPELSLSLPDGWVEIPQDVIATLNESSRQKMPNLKVPEFRYGFQIQADRWMEYPYVLVNVMNNGKVSESGLRSMGKTDGAKKAKGLAPKTGSFITDIRQAEMQYDEASHTIWTESSSRVEGIGNVGSISCIVATERGMTQILAYARESQFKDYHPIFVQLLKSVSIPADIAYKPTTASSLEKKGIWSYVFSTKAISNGIAAGLLALIIAWHRGKSRSKDRPIS